MAEAIVNIGLLATMDPELGQGPLGVRERAAVVIEHGRIAWIGDARDAPAADGAVDAQGGCLLPGFVDSHSHLVFGGERTAEFDARMSGAAYTAGGIRSTVRATREATSDTLADRAQALLDEALASGTTTMEIKSGYGLTTRDELRLLQVAGQFTPETTLLGAHVVPQEFETDRAGYVALVAGDMLRACSPHAKWIDAFCERGAFDVDETRTILSAGAAAGLGVRIHGNQLTESGAARLGVELGAASVDHCTFLADADVDALAGSNTVATFVPGAEFSTRQPFPDITRLRDAGVSFAIATDCNPGSSFTTSMPFCIALAVRDMHMTPSEAVLAATLGGAKALRREDVGRIAVGARADLVLLKSPSFVHLAYRPGVNLIRRTWKDGSTSPVWPREALTTSASRR